MVTIIAVYVIEPNLKVKTKNKTKAKPHLIFDDKVSNFNIVLTEETGN